MSVVTDLIITCGLSEENGADENFPAIDHINRYLESDGCGKLTHLNGHEGGTKHWQINVFGGAFNHLRLAELADAVRTAPWDNAGSVTILVKLEENEMMREVLLADRPGRNRGAARLRACIPRFSPAH